MASKTEKRDKKNASSDESICEPADIVKSKDNGVIEKLISLGFDNKEIEFICENGERYFRYPKVLAKRLIISYERAENALEILKSSKRTAIKRDYAKKIENCLRDNPEFESIEEIALMCEISKELVAEHLDSKPLAEKQKDKVKELFNKGNEIDVIARELNSTNNKVQQFVDLTFLTFSGEEGGNILNIILKKENMSSYSGWKIREMVIAKDLKLQDQLCCRLSKTNKEEFHKLSRYFNKFDESRSFFAIDTNLTIGDILLIKQSNLDIEQLSIRLHKVESVITEHLQSYSPYKAERDYYLDQQQERIKEITKQFGKISINIENYKTIISESLDSLIERVQMKKSDSIEVFTELLPLILYYLKCSLSFLDITRIIAEVTKLTLTSYDIFHLIFQQSDPFVRGLCIEHYSFSNPVPLHYPRLQISSHKGRKLELDICSELWYSIQEYKGLISFGIGRAGWNPIGKSRLLDLIFETDFVEGNNPNSPFHTQSIDIQMSKNLFAEVNKTSKEENLKWAYIDCHSYSERKLIECISRYLDIALIHVNKLDYLENHAQVTKDIQKFEKDTKHLYIFIRDCAGTDEVRTEKGGSKTWIFIPNLTMGDMKIYSSLKAIGYEILHLSIENSKLIGTEFMESVMSELRSPELDEVKKDSKLLKKCIKKHPVSSSEIDFSFLAYYPHFVQYMRYFYRAASDTDRDEIAKYNAQCVKLNEQLNHSKMGDIVLRFNRILERRYSGLILWKLSQELSNLSNLISKKNEGYGNNKYAIEVLWREALLTCKYGDRSVNSIRDYKQRFACNFSNHVARGEVFELIDGDNLLFFNKELNSLLYKLYEDKLPDIDGGDTYPQQAPIVLSIFGPQSSGKSTLLNYCFGCKFLTSAGRCTKGIYASLHTINSKEQLLILDTEGLDSNERGRNKDTGFIHFDRTMVLFCLAVSQVVIINVKGDLGEEMQNLLQICAFSLQKLKVSKVVIPNIFFVLNQQADPDPSKHLRSMNRLLEKLNKESDLMEIEGSKISDLIQVSEDNLFLLPAAFNSEDLNKQSGKLFDSNTIKLSPTVNFAKKCAKLRQEIFYQLSDVPPGQNATFKTMSDWLDMSGVIWDTIIKYQDIVKYRNVDEMKCNNKLEQIVNTLMQKHIICHSDEFENITGKLISEIKTIEEIKHPQLLLKENMFKFDEVFDSFQEQCLTEFTKECQNDKLLKSMAHVCEDTLSNLFRLIFKEKKRYRDKIKLQINAVIIEIKLSKNMEKLQYAITNKIDKYLDLNIEEQEEAFEKIWVECFGDDEREEEEIERADDFHNLYTIFRIETKTMENKQIVFDYFEQFQFKHDTIIEDLRSQIQTAFENCPSEFASTQDYLYPSKENNVPIREMTPFTGETDYEYLGKDTLFTVDTAYTSELIIAEWIPLCCYSLVKYCSGYHRLPDITWEMEERKQVQLLASLLKDPNNSDTSTWAKLLDNITCNVLELIMKTPRITQGIVRELINYVCNTFKHVNYEINHIQAKLTITAETTIKTLVFAHAFKSLCETKANNRFEIKQKNYQEKCQKLDYFIRKVEGRKMARGNWDRREMRNNDRKTSHQFAMDFLESVKRGVVTDQQSDMDKKLNEQKDSFSHENILFLINKMIAEELEAQPDREVLDPNAFVIQCICNRNEVITNMFSKMWGMFLDDLYPEATKTMEKEFNNYIAKLNEILKAFLQTLEERRTEIEILEGIGFDSDSVFIISEVTIQGDDIPQVMKKESSLKAVVLYLRMYLDPKVNYREFKRVFDREFIIDGIRMKIQEDSVLCSRKPTNHTLILDNVTFKKLANTKMFNSEQIFNIKEYVTEFITTLLSYNFEISQDEFEEMIKIQKEQIESNIINCPSRCPSCGKFCEREIHTNSGKCQIKTGHQLCSMGGNVWEDDEDKTAIVSTCDDYKDDTIVNISGQRMNWGKFKEKTGKEWDWTPPQDIAYQALQQHSSENIGKIWNKFGRGILKYHANEGANIKFIPYKKNTNLYKTVSHEISLSTKVCICFVIDGTFSSSAQIDNVRRCVQYLPTKYYSSKISLVFKIVIYRDHCDGKKIIEQHRPNTKFTKQYTIQSCLNGIEEGTDTPKAVLDGLATATTKNKWDCSPGVTNMIVHIFDAPPHGKFPDYKSHIPNNQNTNCCCCNHGTLCNFDWERDVWSIIRRFNIKYYGLSAEGKFDEFNAAMKSKLGELWKHFIWLKPESKKKDPKENTFIEYKLD